ncbi:MAG TPA: zinc metalloprotease HtpX [Acidimicrobiales bacterium]|nr:zinc metalloprotease HtpX [Acidimicrobiales bacterium]
MKNYAKTAILLAGIGGLMIMIGGVFGGRTGMFIGLALGLAFVGFSYWNSDKLAIRAARAVPAEETQMPEYYAIVRELAQKADMPMPKLYVSPEMQPNAFATGRNPDHAAVAVTQGILQVLTWDELRGVLAHELAHVRNRDILISSVAAAVAMGITVLANMAQWAAIFGGGRGDDDEGSNPLALLAMAILAPLAAGILQAALSRTREFEADASGKELIGDGAPLASALGKIEAYANRVPMNIDPAHAQAFIVNPLTGRKMQFANLFRSHPPTEERIRRLVG